MMHKQVYEEFKRIFPQYTDITNCWFQNGKNCIRVRLHGCERIFTYYGPEDWKLETVDSFIKDNFIKGTKGEK